MSRSLLEMENGHTGVDCTMFEFFQNEKTIIVKQITMYFMTMIFC